MSNSIQVIKDIASFIGTRPSETGGLLLAKKGQGAEEVSYFLPDEGAQVTGVTYTPSTHWVEECLAVPGVELRGFVHSHPQGYPQPSDGDFEFVGRWFDANPQLKVFHLPIIEAPPLPRWVLEGVNNPQGWNHAAAILAVRERIRWYVITKNDRIYLL